MCIGNGALFIIYMPSIRRMMRPTIIMGVMIPYHFSHDHISHDHISHDHISHDHFSHHHISHHHIITFHIIIFHMIMFHFHIISFFKLWCISQWNMKRVQSVIEWNVCFIEEVVAVVLWRWFLTYTLVSQNQCWQMGRQTDLTFLIPIINNSKLCLCKIHSWIILP